VTTDPAADLDISPPTLNDVTDAARALDRIAIRTPTLENPEVNARLAGRLLIKAETAQRTGSFKFRGAYNRIRQLDGADRRRGTIAYSSGNHAQAVALAARLLDTSALIVMPADAPAMKMENTRALGAEIITYDRASETREAVAERVQAEGDQVMVPPNEDRRVMAGAGTVALEFLEQARELAAQAGAVLVPCGGGGLTAATAIVMRALSPSTRVYGVEPEQFDDTYRSLQAGERVANPKGRETICDAIMTDMPGALTFSINKDLLAGVLRVDDDEVRAAMTFAFQHFKVVVEPGAAVGLAAVLFRKVDIEGRTIAVIASGGNVEPNRFCEALRVASTSGIGDKG
jgi:threonine dehydratase